jgi:3',5'-cyclic-AMP phosphodiesterase
MVKILAIDRHPIHQIPFQCASSGKRGVTNLTLPIYLGTVDRLPSNLGAIVVTSDLQGIDPITNQLMGHRVAAELEALIDRLDTLPNSLQTGVILAGDLYATLTRRGGLGDVRSIWQDFQRRFRWVAGVAGNHDSFGKTPAEFDEFNKIANLYHLDGRSIRVDELDLAGISGLISTKQKQFCRPQNAYQQLIRELLDRSPDILILHEGPSALDQNLRGNDSIRAELIDRRSLLTICGHVYWKEPLVDLPQGGQILNVDSRVVILVAAKQH